MQILLVGAARVSTPALGARRGLKEENIRSQRCGALARKDQIKIMGRRFLEIQLTAIISSDVGETVRRRLLNEMKCKDVRLYIYYYGGTVLDADESYPLYCCICAN